MLLFLPAYVAQIMSGTVSSNGVSMSFETRIEPEVPGIRRSGGGTLTENNVVKRHLCNFDDGTYFGYDLTAEPLAEGRYRLRFAPLTITPQKMSEIFDKVSNWTPLPLPARPATMEVRAGETVALDLFVNPSTGQKVIDYLTVKGAHPAPIHMAGGSHDFTAEDAVIEIISPTVSVDGKALLSSKGGVSGEAVWIDIPGHGRFVFSLAAHFDLGMQKLGEIRGNTMTWRWAGHEFAIAAAKPIAAGARPYNLYVFSLPRTVDAFVMSAGSKPEDPIRRH